MPDCPPTLSHACLPPLTLSYACLAQDGMGPGGTGTDLSGGWYDAGGKWHTWLPPGCCMTASVLMTR